MADTLYHVTTLKKALRILQEGIQPNKPQIWSKRFGAKFPKGYIYSFDTLMDAIRWAFKMEWALNEAHRLDPIKAPHESVVILSFRGDVRNWEPDNHVEKVSYRGKWFKSVVPVDTEDILIMVNETAWRQEIRKITAKEYFTRTDALITV